MTDGIKKSFWTTIPGALTAVAGILGSIVTILTILNPSTPPVEDLNPTIEEFIAIPFEIEDGETTTLKWDVSGPGSDLKVTIDQGIGEVASSGTKVVTLEKSMAYTLSVVDGKGNKDKETIQVIVKEKKETSSDSRGGSIVVDSIGGGDYSTISNAIDAAEDGDTILVQPGIYHEGIVIDKSLRIMGEGDLGDVILKTTGESVLRFISPSAEVSNLVLKQEGGGDFHAIDIGWGTPTLKGCDITSKSLACIAIYDEADPHIQGNIIHDGKQSGIFVYDDGLGTIEDNDIYGNAYAGIEIGEGGDPSISNNEIHDGKQSGIFVYDDGLGTIEDNDIYSNAHAGIYISEGGDPRISNNEIHDGERHGIYVDDEGLGTIEDNDIYGNARAGIRISKGGDPTVIGNRINENGYEAIWIDDGGAGSFEDNDLRDNDLGPWDVSEDSNPLDLGGNVE